MRWTTKLSCDVKLCQEFWCQKLLKLDNYSSTYSQQYEWVFFSETRCTDMVSDSWVGSSLGIWFSKRDLTSSLACQLKTGFVKSHAASPTRQWMWPLCIKHRRTVPTVKLLKCCIYVCNVPIKASYLFTYLVSRLDVRVTKLILQRAAWGLVYISNHVHFFVPMPTWSMSFHSLPISIT